MFTGIVGRVCPVVSCDASADGVTRLVLDLAEYGADLELGASVAVNGTCLTVVEVSDDCATFEVVKATQTLSNLGGLKAGDAVNVERSLRYGDEVGGHTLSGHTACMVEVVLFKREGTHAKLTLSIPEPWLKYILRKGFIALNGASLTVAEIDREAHTVEVNLIPETLARTTFGGTSVGDLVNLEVDAQTQAIVDTTQAMLRDPQWIASFKTVFGSIPQ